MQRVLTPTDRTTLGRCLRHLFRPLPLTMWRHGPSARAAADLYADLLVRSAALMLLLGAVTRISWRVAGQRFAAHTMDSTRNDVRMARLETAAAMIGVVAFLLWRASETDPDNPVLEWVQGTAQAALVALGSMAVAVGALCLFLVDPAARWRALADCRDQARTAAWYALTFLPFLAMPQIWHELWYKDTQPGLPSGGMTALLVVTSPAWFTYWLRASLLVASHRFQTRGSGSALSSVTGLVFGAASFALAAGQALNDGIDFDAPRKAIAAVATMAMFLALIGLSWADYRRPPHRSPAGR